MMCESNDSQTFCAEVVNTVNHVLNRCLIHPLLKTSPHKVLKGHGPNVSYIQPFNTTHALKKWCSWKNNPTLEDMWYVQWWVKVMILKFFYAEVVNNVNHVLNRTLIHPILKKPPHKLLKGHRPNVSYLQPFNTTCTLTKWCS